MAATSGLERFWDGIWDSKLSDVGRLGLEGGRAVPGEGLIIGLAGDAITGVADVHGIPAGQPDTTSMTFAVAARTAINGLNNALGHISYVQELGTGAAGASGVFIPLKPALDALGVTNKEFKGILDVCQIAVDTAIAVDAEINRVGAGKEADAKWESFARGYEANILGDVGTIFTDIYDAATLTEGQGETIKTVVRALKAIAKTVFKGWKGRFWMYLQGVWNILGGTAVQKGQGQTVTEGGGETNGVRMPGLLDDHKQIVRSHEIGGGLIDKMDGALAKQMGSAREGIKRAVGNTDPFSLVRDAGVKLFKGLDERAGKLESLAKSSESAGQKAAKLRGMCDGGIAAVDRWRSRTSTSRVLRSCSPRSARAWTRSSRPPRRRWRSSRRRPSRSSRSWRRSSSAAATR